MSTVSYQTSPLMLSAEERQRAAGYLTQTRDNLLFAIAGLTNSQWHFKTAPDRWSIAEILEHLAIVEGGIHRILSAIEQAPCAEPNRNNAEVEQIILTQVPRRSSKYSAPSHLLPVRELEPAELLKIFVERRATTLELLTSSTALRGHVAPHPIMGFWDGYQWILAAAAHSARHTEQILEVKADPCFPGTRGVNSVSLH